MRYEDVTRRWYAEATPKSNNIIHAKSFIDDKGNKYIVGLKNMKTTQGHKLSKHGLELSHALHCVA